MLSWASSSSPFQHRPTFLALARFDPSPHHELAQYRHRCAPSSESSPPIGILLSRLIKMSAESLDPFNLHDPDVINFQEDNTAADSDADVVMVDLISPR